MNKSPELLIPRLGDYLVEEKLIRPEDLETALTYQNKIVRAGGNVLLGQALIELGLIQQQVLDNAIVRQLAGLHSALQNANRQLEMRVKERTQELERRVVLIRTAAEITQIAVNAVTLPDLMQRTLDLIVERFGYTSAAIYLVDETYSYLILAEAAGRFASVIKQKNYRVLIGSRSLTGWAAANNQPRLALDVKHDFLYNPDELLSETNAELAIPIAVQTAEAKPAEPEIRGAGGEAKQAQGRADGSKQSDAAVFDRFYLHRQAAEAVLPQSRVVGVLDIQHTSSEGLDQDAVAILQTIANHIASVIQNIRLLEAARVSLNETAVLYHAGQDFTQTHSDNEIFRCLYRSISQIGYPSLLLVIGSSSAFSRTGQEAPQSPFDPPARRTLRTFSTKPLSSRPTGPLEPVTEPALTAEMAEALIPEDVPFLIFDTSQPVKYPAPIMTLPMRLKSSVIAFIPVRLEGKLHALVVIGLTPLGTGQVATLQPGGWGLGSMQPGQSMVEINPVFRRDAAIQTCVSLANMASDALARVMVVEVMEKRVAALQSFANISSIISMDMEPASLYKAIHTEVLRIIGDVNFLIALYDKDTDMIQVPYLYEANAEDTSTVQQIPPFPMGEGLTSILINTRKPLMLVEDAEEKARQLGAKTVGRASKSWLGIPLIVAGEVIGAIIVQDLEQEHRFNDDDLRLLITLGSQVAISMRTAQLLENARKQVERQRLISEITTKIRSSNDMNTILETTTVELRKALGAARTRVELGVPSKAVQPAPSGPTPLITTNLETRTDQNGQADEIK